MTADVYLHSMAGVTNADLACLLSTDTESRWFSEEPRCTLTSCSHRTAVGNSPRVELGKEGSAPIAAITSMLAETLPVLDTSLIERLIAATEPLPHSADIAAWLGRNRGERVFTVTW